MQRKRKPSANSSNQPDISFIVSAYDDPTSLACCLWSLSGQTHSNFECIVTDNSLDKKTIATHQKHVRNLNDERFCYFNTSRKIKISDCYWSAEWGAAKARGLWLCFPCDDCYYLPEFSRRMLITAAQTEAQVVLSEYVLMGPEAAVSSGTYQRVKSNPMRLIKTAFLIRASAFPGFSGKPKASVPASADQVLGHELMRTKAKFGICEGMTVTHN